METTGMSRTERLNRTLRRLQADSPDVEASALISEDGLMIASALPADMEEVRVGGMSATLHSLGSRAANMLNLGNLEQVLIRGENGYAVMLRATSGTMLLVLTNKKAKLGLIFLDMSQSAAAIAQII